MNSKSIQLLPGKTTYILKFSLGKLQINMLRKQETRNKWGKQPKYKKRHKNNRVVSEYKRAHWHGWLSSSQLWSKHWSIHVIWWRTKSGKKHCKPISKLVLNNFFFFFRFKILSAWVRNQLRPDGFKNWMTETTNERTRHQQGSFPKQAKTWTTMKIINVSDYNEKSYKTFFIG